MNFSEALNALKQGLKLARHGWNGKNLFVCLEMKNPSLENPLLFITYPNGSKYAWLSSQGDILAEDWFIID